MKSLQEFLYNFFKNKGQHVFLSLLVAKICAFLGSLFIIRILPESEFGTISIVASIFAIFMPFSGFGSQQSLLRFGSISESIEEKKTLAGYLFKQGFIYQLLLSVFFLLISVFFVNKYDDIFYIFLFFCLRLIGFYFLNYLQSEFRILGNNLGFAQISNVVNIFGVILLLILSYFFGLKGYLLAIAFTPFVSLFWFKKNHFISAAKEFNFTKKEIWRYGLHSSGTALMSDALFSIDILLLGFLLNETAVANYKVAILIPTNITFLAITFMQSDFPILAKNYRNRDFLKNYIQNYYKIFIPICSLVFLIGFLFRHFIWQQFFGLNYKDNSQVFTLFLFVFCCNMLFRNLYGNLLSAVGKMKINTLISFSALVLISSLAIILVPKYGVFGMAISMSITLLFTGFALMSFFFNYLKNLSKV